MRKIKFRMWCGDLGQYFEHKNINYGYAVDQHNTNEVILEQFTGLHDKDDVEIYEGDIVRIIDTGEKSTHVVKYFGDIDYPAFDTHPQLGVDCNGLTWAVSYPDCEIFVIGNIHENPSTIKRGES